MHLNKVIFIFTKFFHVLHSNAKISLNVEKLFTFPARSQKPIAKCPDIPLSYVFLSEDGSESPTQTRFIPKETHKENFYGNNTVGHSTGMERLRSKNDGGHGDKYGRSIRAVGVQPRRKG